MYVNPSPNPNPVTAKPTQLPLVVDVRERFRQKITLEDAVGSQALLA
jgi:hypothetical protein